MIAAWLAATAEAERDRLALWLPVCFGAGAAAYFALSAEPTWWWAPAAGAVTAAIAVALRHSLPAVLGAVALAVAAAGFSYAQWWAGLIAEPTIVRRLGPVAIEARLVALERRPDEGYRATFDRLAVPGLAAAETPARARLRLGKAAAALEPGQRVALRAILLPPPPPAAPGAFDFQRQAWFEGIGAVGYALGEPRVIEGAVAPGWRVRVNALRRAVHERVIAALPAPAGAIAAALLTGDQTAIPSEVQGWMRDSGLAHLLSISGLHIGLVAGFVFLLVRGGLALVPFVALRQPIKKWAAVAAFAAITFYMLFATPSVPTQRAWLMTTVVLAAVLIDRRALSMRLIAFAAFAVLLIDPASVLGPSFQMSFAAVAALIAAYEALREPMRRWRSAAGPVRKGLFALAATGLTTLVAGFASAPFAIYHFNRFAAYGLLANLIAVPLTSVWVMPWAVFAFLLMPLGLERLALAPMGWGVEAIVRVAREVAGLAGATSLIPAMAPWGLAAVALGGAWLCLWRTRWRLAGLPAVAAGLASIALYRGPDVLVSGDGRLLAVRGADGLLQVSAPRAEALTREMWLRREGQDQAGTWPSAGASADGTLACDPVGCIYRARGHTVALVRDAAALAEDCRRANVVVAVVPVRRGCTAPRAVVDRFALWRDGGHALWLEDGGRVRVESVRSARGDRPWIPPPPAPRARSAGTSAGAPPE